MKVKSTSTEALSFGGLPTNMDYIITSKEEEVVDAAFQHRRWVGRLDAEKKIPKKRGCL
jgi:hypothetical protein